MKAVEIKIPSDPKYLKLVRCGINHLCELCEFSEEVSNAVTLAVNEAVTNIMKHAYFNVRENPIIIKCEILHDRLEIVLRDFGIKADQNKIKSRELDDIKPGGLGVHLIKKSMDIVNYDTSFEKGNQLILAKYLPQKKGNNANG
jgi:anti-sigma regulatory factor (Ser/Thr protein kinase)